MLHDIEVVEEAGGFELLRKGNKYAIVYHDACRGQVLSAVKGDSPKDGGRWYASYSDGGVDYVARWYSKSYVRKLWHAILAEVEEQRAIDRY